MGTVADYDDYFAGRTRALVFKLGIADLGAADLQTQALVIAFSAQVAALSKVLIDKLLITEAEVANVLDAAIAGAVPGWRPPSLQVPINTLLGI